MQQMKKVKFSKYSFNNKSREIDIVAGFGAEAITQALYR